MLDVMDRMFRSLFSKRPWLAFLLIATLTALGTACSSSNSNPESKTAEPTYTPTAQQQPTIIPTSTPLPPKPSPTSIPSGRGRIVFQSDRDGGFDLYLMNVDGTGITRLIESPPGVSPTLRLRKDQPAWSQDYTKVAYISRGNGVGGIYIVNADGTGVRLVFDRAELLPGIATPAWSPSGRELAFEASRDIYVLDLASRLYTNITNDPAVDEHPSWSPDGKHIVFDSSRNGGGIFVMARDGSDPTRLASGTAPEWSPDGSRIVYVFNGDIYAMNSEGSRQSRLTVAAGRDISPSWSPDGAMIVFDSERDGNEEIYVMNADGSNQSRITTEPGYDVNPSW
jgi:Tol biopolymer transport system component